MMPLSLGVDIGGTKIAAGLVDKQGTVYDRLEFPTLTESEEETYNQVRNTIEKVLIKSRLTINEIVGIGVGVPGEVDSVNGVAVFQANIPWHNFPVVDRLEADYKTRVVMDNDVHMAAFGEWYFSGKNVEEMFLFLTVSTGIFCSIIERGEILRGKGFAGEIGHTIILPNGPSCRCGNRGCLEAIASGPAIQSLANQRFQELNLLKDKSVTILQMVQIMEDYKKGIPYAVGTIDETFNYLAHGIHILLKLLDPSRLIIGGGVINNHPQFIGLIQEKLNPFFLPDRYGMIKRVHPSLLKGNAGLIGAGLKAHSIKEL